MAKDTVKIEGLAGLAKAFRALEEGLQGRSLLNAVIAGIQPIRNETVALAPKETADYSRKIGQDARLLSPTRAEAVCATDDDRGPWLEFGTGIHGTGPGATKERIRPKKAKMLAFHWPDAPPDLPRLDDGRIILRSVAGIKPQPHFRPAYDSKKDEAVNETREALREIIESIARKNI